MIDGDVAIMDSLLVHKDGPQGTQACIMPSLAT